MLYQTISFEIHCFWLPSSTNTYIKKQLLPHPAYKHNFCIKLEKDLSTNAFANNNGQEKAVPCSGKSSLDE